MTTIQTVDGEWVYIDFAKGYTEPTDQDLEQIKQFKEYLKDPTSEESAHFACIDYTSKSNSE